MKTKVFLIAFFAGLFMLTFTSCKQIVDMRLSSLEKSIDKLEKNYKDLTPTQLDNAINACEVKIEWLEDHKENFTSNQRKQFRKLNLRYYWLLVRIPGHKSIGEIDFSEEYESVLDNIQDFVDELKDTVDEVMP